MSEDDVHLKKFQKELSAGTVSLALLAVLARETVPELSSFWNFLRWTSWSLMAVSASVESTLVRSSL